MIIFFLNVHFNEQADAYWEMSNGGGTTNQLNSKKDVSQEEH